MGDGNFPLMPSHSVGCLVTSHPMPEVPTQSSLGALELTLVPWNRRMGERLGLTCRMTLSGWWKLGALQRALEFSCVAGHKPRSFRPQVKTLK